MPIETLPVESRRMARMKRVQTVQHVLAAIVLIVDATGHLHHIAVLPVLEVLVASALIFAAVRERVRHLRGAHEERFAWLEIAGAVMVGFEAYQRTRGHHHTSFIILSFVQPAMLFAFAIFDAELQQLRYVRASDDFVEVRTRPLFRGRMRWSDMKSFRVKKTTLHVTRHNGSVKKLKVRDVKDREAALAWLRDQFARRGVPELPAE
jgi:hypothetical protein